MQQEGPIGERTSLTPVLTLGKPVLYRSMIQTFMRLISTLLRRLSLVMQGPPPLDIATACCLALTERFLRPLRGTAFINRIVVFLSAEVTVFFPIIFCSQHRGLHITASNLNYCLFRVEGGECLHCSADLFLFAYFN